MGAGTYIGRVGGLAVALGIGAAVFTGAASAAADDGTGTSATSTASSDSASQKNEAKASAAVADAPERDRDDEADAGTDTADADTADTADADTADGYGVEAKKPKDKKDKKATEDKNAAEDMKGTGDEESPAEAPQAEVSTDGSEPVDSEPADSEPADSEPADNQPADSDPAELPATGLAAAPTTSTPDDLDQDDPGSPGVPALASLVTSLAMAGRQTTEASGQATGETVTTSATEASYPVPTGVKVTEVVAPLQFLQDIPVLGQYVVTPIVQFIHSVPLLGEALHPFIGWPIDHDAPPGTPRPRTVLVESFDGTSIYVNFMPARGLKAGETAPTVLNGPGLGLPGATTLDLEWDGLLPNDVIGVGALRGAGYNVVTWDPRGEWHSGGVMNLNSPDMEGRDVSAIISWAATQPEVQLDGVNDPRLGMVGASYGGGIQLATASIDHRIDAIVPTIAWNSLVDVLFPRDAVNSSWGTLLPSVLVLTLAREHPRILPVAIMGVLFGYAQQSDIDLVTDLGYQEQIKDITAPTLLIQGTVDTLFTLDQADAVARQLISAGTTTKVIWYCGGHGTCLSDHPRGDVVIDRTLDWLDRYVKGDETTDVGTQFEWVDQNGTWHHNDTYPAPADTTPIVAGARPASTLPYIPFLGGSGPNWSILTREPIQVLLGLPSAAAAANAVNLNVPDATESTHIVGAPQLTLTYSGTGTAAHVYAQIVDDETGLVLGNQTTAIPVTLDGQSHTVTYSLEQVAHTLEPGQSVTVQIVTSSVKFFNFYSWGAITVEEMSIELPTLEAAGRANIVAA